jgi:glycosyltransferase involved in cell wall biosynthesis
MKIAHVVDSMEMGGAETLVSQMSGLQREAGHNPCVYAIADLGTLGEKMRAEGFSVQSNVGRKLTDSTRNFYHLFRNSRPDVVHLHNPTPTIYAAVAARTAGVCSVISTRHSLVAPPHNMRAEFKYAIAARFCDWITGICEATTENLRNLNNVPARKLVCVYNGAAPLRRAVKGGWPSKDGFTLVYVGRLEPVKNHTLLLKAFRDAHTSMPHLRLWMVGDGSERKGLEKLTTELAIAGQVTFWGQQHDVAPFLSAADAFIMSSKSEGLPISLLQAFSLGLPAIVTDVGGMAEVVKLAKAGITASLTEPAEMTAAILRMAANHLEREQFARNAEATFNSRFSLQSMVNCYMKLYENTSRAQRRAKK